MLYSYKEYNDFINSNPKSFNFENETTKKLQSKIIIERICKLLNEKSYVYNNFDELTNNFTTYQDFIKKNNLTTAIKLHSWGGNILNEEDFAKIITNFKEYCNVKNSIDTKNINTQNIDDKQFVSAKGEDGKMYYFDNSMNDSFEKQMKKTQEENNSFKTANPEKNTNDILKYHKEYKNSSIHPMFLNDINIDMLNSFELELYNFAKDYQIKEGKPIRIDLNNKVIVDENNNFIYLTIENGIIVAKNNKGSQISNEKEEKTKTFEKTLKQNQNTIYNNIAA